MALKVNQKAVEHLRSLVSQGKVDRNSNWSFSAEDGNALLGAAGSDWSNYSQNHLAVDTSAAENTKARFHYPAGKDGKVYRSGVIAAKQRAAAQGEKDIENAADDLLQLIDRKAQSAKGEVKAKRVVFCQVDLGVIAGDELPTRINLLPLGEWKGYPSVDQSGKPVLLSFKVTPDRVKQAIAYLKRLRSRNSNLDLVIDNDHLTHADTYAPAFGWIKDLIDAGEKGLDAVVEWTALGAEALKNKLYRYISPVLAFDLPDSATGEIIPFAVTDAGLTNQPFIESLPAVMAKKIIETTNNAPMGQGEIKMDKILALLQTWLKLPDAATPDEVATGLEAKLKEENAEPDEVQAKKLLTVIGFDEGTTVEQAKATVIMAKQHQSQTLNVAQELAAMKAAQLERDVNELVDGAIREGKVFPVNREDFVVMAKKDFAGIKTFLSKAPVVGPLNPMPAGRESGGVKAPSDTDKEVAAALGIDAAKMVE
ncbi:MAG: phage protease [Bacteroidetes bacterium]|nr:phage protease [Bacteroidota bacterium]